MNIKKIIVLALIALAIYFVVSDPQGSAGGVQGVVAWLQGVAQSVITFLRNLFQQ